MTKSKPGPLGAYLIVAIFVLIGIGFSLVVPPFETPDEIYHYGFARHLAAGNPLPVQSVEANGPWEQEGSQAPLYYLIVGGLTSWIDQNDFEAISVYNPRANIGSPLLPGNKNRMLYSAQSLPLRNANLALHIGRWFSVLLGAITLWAVYRSALLLFVGRNHLALAALLLLATIPQFAFISASFSNDALVTALCSLTIYWLAYLLVQAEGQRQSPPWHWLLLGVLLGLAALSKLQGLGLFPLAGLTMIYFAWRSGDRRGGDGRSFDWRNFVLRSLWVALPVLLIAGWWYWRNFTLYNDWLGTGNLKAINGERATPLTLAAFWNEFRGVRYSFWGLFGWFSIPLPLYFYTALDILSSLALVGGAIALLRRAKGGVVFALFLLWTAIGFVLMLYWMSDAMGGQGRLIFPAIGTIVILIIAGIDQFTRWKFVPFLPSLGLALALGYSLFWLLPTAYHAPGAIAQLPDSLPAIDLHFVNPDEPGLELQVLAIESPTTRVYRDQLVPITLYLRANQQPQQDYQLFVQLLDPAGNAVANLTSHPGWGRNPTRLWQAGAIYRDSYLLSVTPAADLPLPARLRLYTGFIKPGTEAQGSLPLPGFAADGSEVTPILNEVVLAANPPNPPPALTDLKLPDLKPNGAQFAGVIQLQQSGAPQSVAAGSTFTVTLLWQALGTPATDYTSFVHLIGEDGQQLIGSDHAPAGDRLPTRLWRANDQIVDQHLFSLPASASTGSYAVWVGLYESASGGSLRLPISDAAGNPSGDGVVQIGTITVSR